jgi:hypothetical protein
MLLQKRSAGFPPRASAKLQPPALSFVSAASGMRRLKGYRAGHQCQHRPALHDLLLHNHPHYYSFLDVDRGLELSLAVMLRKLLRPLLAASSSWLAALTLDEDASHDVLPGEMALEYFKGNNPGAEAMQEGSNEAEWIVDLTTHADRDDMCALQGLGPRSGSGFTGSGLSGSA